MGNGIFGINISAETKNTQSYPVHPVIIAEFKSPNDFEMGLKDIDEELCKEKERNSATEVFMDS